jgi:hypothetical protein
MTKPVEEGAVDDVDVLAPCEEGIEVEIGADELDMIEVDEPTAVEPDELLAIAVLLLMTLVVLLDDTPPASRYQFSLGSPRHSLTVIGV